MLLEKSPQFVHRFRRSHFFCDPAVLGSKKIWNNLHNLGIKILGQTLSDFCLVDNNFGNAASFALLVS